MPSLIPQKTFSRLHAALAALVFVIGAIGAGPVVAQTPVPAVNGLLGELRAQGAQITFESVSPGKREREVRFSHLTIAFPRADGKGGAEISFAALDLSGVGSDKDRIAIEQARGEDVRLTVNGGGVSIARVNLEALALPRSTGTGKVQTPFQTLVGALRQALGAQFKAATFEEMSVEHPFGSAATLSAARLDAGALRDGAVARIVIARPRRVEASSDRVIAADEIVLENLNLMRIVEILDFRPRTDAARDWQPLAEGIDVKGFADTEAAERKTIEHIRLSGLRLRRFADDAEKDFELAASNPAYFKEHPDEARRFGEALQDVVRLDRLSAEKLTATNGKAPVPRLSGFESLVISGLDIRGAAAITLDNAQDHQGANGLGIGHAAMTRLEFVETGGEADKGAPGAKTPYFGGLSIHDAKWVLPIGAIELRAFDWSATDRVGLMPTKLRATISDMSLPPAISPDVRLRASLIKSGVSALRLDADLSANWDEVSRQIILDHAELSISELGRIEMSGAFVGAPGAAFQNAQSIQAAFRAGSIKDFRVRFTDAGLSDRLVGVLAEANQRTPEQIREALTANMPAILGAIPDASARDSLIFALVGFLNAPQTLEFTSLARTPVPVAALADAFGSTPSALPGLLRLEAKATHTRCFAGSTKACRDESASPR